MYNGSLIYERIEELARKSGMTVTGASRKASVSEGTARKMRDTDSGGSLDTLASFARVLETSVAYLIGETDDPSPSAPLRASGQTPRRWVVRAGAGATFADPGRPALGLSLEDDEGEELLLLIPEPVARVFADRVSRGLREIGDYMEERESSASAS